MENKIIEGYEPFGKEWEKSMMRLPKKFIIDLYKKSCEERILLEVSKEACQRIEQEASKNFGGI